MFSHSNIWHLAANMFVLSSFAPSLMNWFGREQFVALYLSSGVWASFLSKSLKILTRNPVPSVGASGALLGIVAFHCLLYPDSRIGIIFIPFFSVKAAHALYGLMAVDTVGVLMRWRFLDHAAHLGGALYGMFFYYFGLSIYMQKLRQPLISTWHDIRTKKDH
jgi:rhomboid-like protein